MIYTNFREIDKAGRIVISKDIRNHLNIKPGDIASNEMVVFVVMNTASLQLLPTTLAALRQSYGSSAPFEIIVPVWISSACALTVALLIACTLNIRQDKI